jgi:hypothetical protein
MSTLTYSALTSSGRAFDIEFPLHPETRSQEAVSAMLTGLLESLSKTVEERKDVSDGDVLQALAMTLAIRARMIDAAPETLRSLVGELFETAFEAAEAAQVYAASRS